ncbi:galactose-1-epimerase [Conservatibacter flavescens]|uniref:Aldose 1-epimerase n=1 Tax=Conservatibacter flavescens TaxID=28161 RepID=A0A2M8S033_9PAST|nr:galactose-1-epimerase [Conservatibacter flavescens]PJG84499.1 galactose-1-epimerase [Conservatibacter flavescens]
MLTPQIIRLTNSHGMVIELMDWGATWLSCQVPVNGELREVLLGCRPQDYRHQQAYLGATIGRYANRIANSRFLLNGKWVELTPNQGEHQLHGGNGFDKRTWQVEKCGQNFVEFSLFSPDGDQGFVGNVQVKVVYRLTEDNGVEVEFEAQSDEDTPLNLTNHAYFNLENAQTGRDVRNHILQLHATQYLPVDSAGIPNAPLKSVEQTTFDFRQGKVISQDFLQDEQKLTKGYDHAFLLDHRPDFRQVPVAHLTTGSGELGLKIYTSQPALQVYTGNYLGGTPTREQGVYADYSGIALETQALPDTPNHPEWRHLGGISKAREWYQHWTKFAFVT